MSPWKTLYAMTWLVVVAFLLAMWPRAPAWAAYAHAALGVGLVLLASGNARAVRATAVPGRVKRTARSTVQLSVGAAVLGALLLFDVGAGWTLLFGVTVWALLLLLHVVLAIAVLAQAAAVGMSYDMWEEKEFLAETAPGDVPALPQPDARSKAH